MRDLYIAEIYKHGLSFCCWSSFASTQQALEKICCLSGCDTVVQVHQRSSKLVPIENSYAYLSCIITTSLSYIVSGILRFIIMNIIIIINISIRTKCTKTKTRRPTKEKTTVAALRTTTKCKKRTECKVLFASRWGYW